MIVTNLRIAASGHQGLLFPCLASRVVHNVKFNFLLDSKLERDSSNDSNAIYTSVVTYLAYNHDSIGSQR